MAKQRLPEFTVIGARRVEPIGGGLIRMIFSVADGAGWVDRVALVMPAECVADALGFVTVSAAEITQEAAANTLTTH